VFDLLGRDGARTKELFGSQVERQGFFTLSAEEFDRIRAYGFVSGSSNHGNRLATIRDTHARFGVMIDTHTADGLKVARQWAQPGVPMLVLETALPAKFAQTLVEALGCEPDRPKALDGIENLPKRYTVLPADVAQVKAYIEAHA
jgi:threonine synthase